MLFLSLPCRKDSVGAIGPKFALRNHAGSCDSGEASRQYFSNDSPSGGCVSGFIPLCHLPTAKDPTSQPRSDTVLHDNVLDV